MHRARLLSIVAALLFACTGDDGDDQLSPKDGSVPIRDVGPAMGPICGNGLCEPDESPTCIDCRVTGCVDGVEGCGCVATTVAAPFVRDDCHEGLVCAAWGDSVQSCIRPCETDAECADDQSCSGSFGAVGSFCVDRVVFADEHCGGSRLVPSTNGEPRKTPRVIVGCQSGSKCVLGSFDELHPDDGVCLELCERNGDRCPEERPYCNPAAIEIDGSPRGVCTVAQLGIGSRCGDTSLGKQGVVTACDTSREARGAVRCIGVQDGYSICLETCGPMTSCRGADVLLGAFECEEEVLDLPGVCLSPTSSDYPDNCGGPSVDRVGRFRLSLGDSGVCADRLKPLLTPATIDTTGTIVQTGDHCGFATLGFARCPDGTACIAGRCVIGCDPTDVDYCEGGLRRLQQGTTNATCTAVFDEPERYACGGD